MAEKSCWDLERVKKEYSKLQSKYKLPSFDKLNEDFDTERISEKETDYLLREIRKAIADKVIAYLRFIEALINPSSGPMFFMIIVKGLELKDKDLIDKIYKSLAKYEIDIVDLDNLYSEKKEADFISKIYKSWQDVKEDIDKLVKLLRENWEKDSKQTEKGYLG